MATRAELRTALRRRLEDAGGSPLWDDAILNDALAGAIGRYGGALPEGGGGDGERDGRGDERGGGDGRDRGRADRPGAGRDRRDRGADGRGGGTGAGTAPGAAGLEQAWRWWNGELRLQRPAAATGTWRIEYRGPRSAPADDVSAVDVTAGDEEIVLTLAAAIALRRRAVEDGKRGAYGRGDSPALALAERAGDRGGAADGPAAAAGDGWLGGVGVRGRELGVEECSVLSAEWGDATWRVHRRVGLLTPDP